MGLDIISGFGFRVRGEGGRDEASEDCWGDLVPASEDELRGGESVGGDIQNHASLTTLTIDDN